MSSSFLLHPEPAKKLLIVTADGARSPEPPLAYVAGPFAADGNWGFIAAGKALGAQWGYLNHAGEWIVASPLDNARARGPDGLSRFPDQGLWGFRDLTGQIVIAPGEEAKGAATDAARWKPGTSTRPDS